jgi:hypothetical protein
MPSNLNLEGIATGNRPQVGTTQFRLRHLAPVQCALCTAAFGQVLSRGVAGPNARMAFAIVSSERQAVNLKGATAGRAGSCPQNPG